MLGIILAIVAAFIQALGDIGKKKLTAIAPPALVNWIPVTFGVIAGGAFHLIYGFPLVNWETLAPVAMLAAALLILIEFRFVKAISSGDLSLVMPFTATIPIFSGLVAWGMSGEEPTRAALIGILVIVVGSWLMFANLRNWQSILEPFKQMIYQPAPRYALQFCFLNGFFINIMKMGGEQSSSLFFLWIVLIQEWIVLSIILAKQRVNPLAVVLSRPLLAIGTGIGWGLGIALVFVSISLTLVAYATAANRSHALFVVLLSYIILKEGDIKRRLVACSIMLIGVFIILFGR